MAENKILSLDEILTASDQEERTVPVPAWGGAVRVRGVTRREHQILVDKCTNRKTDKVDSDRLEMWLMVTGMVEPTINPAQYQKLLDKSTGAVQTVLNAILELSGLKAGAVEEAEAEFREEA